MVVTAGGTVVGMFGAERVSVGSRVTRGLYVPGACMVGPCLSWELNRNPNPNQTET